jgi:hypothetical protein
MRKFEYQYFEAQRDEKTLEFLNSLGRDGWELVQLDFKQKNSDSAADYCGYDMRARGLFKREINQK